MKASIASKMILGLVAVAVGAAQLLIPDPADAASALFRLRRNYYDIDPTYGTYSFPPITPAGKVPPATAYVGTTTPAQKVTIPAELIKWTNYTYSCKGGNCWPGYPVSILYYSYWNYRGFFYPDNPNAATTTTTVYGATYTTRNGGYYDEDRAGTIKITPGPNRFGGTMRYFYGPNHRSFNSITNSSPCCSTGTGMMYRTPYGGNVKTEYMQQKIGSTYPGWVGNRRHTSLTTGPPSYGPFTRRVRYFYTTAPWTTGTLHVRMPIGSIFTDVAVAGYDNRTDSGYYGQLSLVVPWLVHNYLITPGEPIIARWHEATINENVITFFGAPEPGGILLLGVGIATLAGLIRLRRR
jgi:hypothetical protein